MWRSLEAQGMIAQNSLSVLSYLYCPVWVSYGDLEAIDGHVRVAASTNLGSGLRMRREAAHHYKRSRH